MDKNIKKTFVVAFVFFLVVAWAYLFFSSEINLNGADLGRHLKNGEIITNSFFSGHYEMADSILKKNVYSYTYPDYEFINHHWLSGVFFYLIQRASGFWGLSLFHFLIKTTAYLLIFYVAYKEFNLYFAFLSSLIAAPLIANRYEVRPEDFTYLFIAIILLILYLFYRKNSCKYLFIIPIITLIWVNLNAYFIFGHYLLILLLGIEFSKKLFFNKKVENKKVLYLSILIFANFLASLINPFFVKGALYPFFIKNEISIPILELSNVFQLNNLPDQYCFVFIPLFFGVIIILNAYLIYSNRNKKSNVFDIGVDIFFTTLFFLYILEIRNSAFMGYISIITLSGFFYRSKIFMKNEIFDYIIKNKKGYNSIFYFKGKFYKIIFSLFAVFFILSFYLYDKETITNVKINRFGINSDANKATQYFLEKKLKGPIFNNFEVSSYLIYYLYPKERMYVDQRPEAFPAYFQRKAAYEIFSNDDVWEEENRKYNFNSIILNKVNNNFKEQTSFIAKRKKDDKWRLEYEDEYSIIFVKNETIKS